MKKLYIVVRSDQEFSRGKLMVHVGHVCTKLTFRHSRIDQFLEWYHFNDQTKIILKGRDEQFLSELRHLSMINDLIWIMVPDEGYYYEVEKGTILMIGILATDEEAEKIGLKKLSLYK